MIGSFFKIQNNKTSLKCYMKKIQKKKKKDNVNNY